MSTIICIAVVTFFLGCVCGWGIEKTFAPVEKLAFDEYQLIVRKINTDVTIATELRQEMLKQLDTYMNDVTAKINDLHVALQGFINEVKTAA